MTENKGTTELHSKTGGWLQSTEVFFYGEQKLCVWRGRGKVLYVSWVERKGTVHSILARGRGEHSWFGLTY